MVDPSTPGPRPFLFVLHDHQPVGNFDAVFAQAFQQAYRPTLEVLERAPRMKLALHLSGPLLEWIAREEGAFLDRIAALVERGQVEVLGGGFYEPILSVLPDGDAAGQVEMMGNFCQRYFGRRPTGLWLAERVWDPDLPRILAPAGIRYTLLDDTVFRAAGVPEAAGSGWFLTEKAGHPLAVFPIDQGLRYAIPFRAPAEVVALIERAPGHGAVTYGDDGEKLGLWPRTSAWVHDQGWLATFFAALAAAEDEGRVRVALPAEELERASPTDWVYLPSGSYEELMGWALPPAGWRELRALHQTLDDLGERARFGGFVRGATWPSFLARYSEANHLHKKMLHVSARLERATEEAIARAPGGELDGDLADLLGTAQRELYKGQCCCAYWHGQFGGLYFGWLRGALFRSLITAERILDGLEHGPEPWIGYEQADLDLDGRSEVLVANAELTAFLRPEVGATLQELDWKPGALNLLDVLTRREEGAHALLRAAVARPPVAPPRADEPPRTIHDVVRAKTDDLERALIFDDGPRASFVNRFFALDVDLERVRARSGAEDLGDFARGRYRLESLGVRDEDTSFHLAAWRTGTVRIDGALHPVAIEKRYRMVADAARVEVRWTLRNEGPRAISAVFATDLAVHLPAGDDPLRVARVDGGAPLVLGVARTDEGVRHLALRDGHLGLAVDVELGAPARLFRYPIETVSSSEDGFERTFQGTCFVPTWPLTLEPGTKHELTVTVALSKEGA